MLRRLRYWLSAALMAIASLGLAQQPTCEDRLALAEKQLLVLRDERDRAQQNVANLWVQAEKLERAQRLQSKAAEDGKEGAAK